MKTLHFASALLTVALSGALLTGQAPAPQPSNPLTSSSVVLAGPNEENGNQSSTLSNGNWSGYIQRGHQFKEISATFRVPRLKTSVNGYASTWVGLDGSANRHLAQIGVEENVVHHRPSYYAWWEVLSPEHMAPEQPAPVPVRPGDLVNVEVSRHGANVHMRLTNETQNRSFSIDRPYTGVGASGEWIQEDVTFKNTISRAPNWGKAQFSGITLDGHPANISVNQRMDIVDSDGSRETQTDPPNDNGTGFIVHWLRHGHATSPDRKTLN